MAWVDPALMVMPPSIADALDRPDQAAAALTLLEPGPSAVSALGALFASRLSDAGLMDALVAVERQLAMLAAKQQEFLAEIARRDPDGDEYLRDEVPCALKLAPATAQDRLDTAVALTSRLWDTRELMDAGRLSYVHGRILASATEHLSDDVTAKVQARVLRRADVQTPGEFRAAVRRAVARYDTRDQAERHAEAFTDRAVICRPEPDGMASIWMRLAADGAATIMTALNACAAVRESGDERTADQRRADAAVEIALAALDNPNLPTAHGLRPAVSITIAESTLRGLDDQPAELEGYGPIPASMGRRIAGQPGATFRYWTVDANGRLLDKQPGQGETSTERYEPTVPIARHVTTRDQHCVHPGCRRKATRCELDHRIPWPAGATSIQNLQPLCKRHHDLKHHSRWRVEKRPNGDYDWTSPTGHTYRYRPPELPVPTRQNAPEPDDEPPPF
jgi:hypothetical protein